MLVKYDRNGCVWRLFELMVKCISRLDILGQPEQKNPPKYWLPPRFHLSTPPFHLTTWQSVFFLQPTERSYWSRPTDQPIPLILPWTMSRLADRPTILPKLSLCPADWPTDRLADRQTNESPDLPISRSPDLLHNEENQDPCPATRPTDRPTDRPTNRPTDRPMRGGLKAPNRSLKNTL